MMGMMKGVIIVHLLGIIVAIGFAYIVLIMARKENGITKMVGQIIAFSIAILAIIILIWAGIYGPKMQKKMCSIMNMKMDMAKMMMGGNDKMPAMMKHKMMGNKRMTGNMMDQMLKNVSKEDMKKYMDQMMQNPEMKKCVEDYIKTKK